jgi:transcriptional regulator with XRE-family HTH domain
MPGTGKSVPPADAILACPLTFTSVNKVAGGIADNFAVGLICEMAGYKVPIVVVPHCKPLRTQDASVARCRRSPPSAGSGTSMTPNGLQDVGQRIATARRRRGLPQAVLAGLVGRSESWLSQVERGKRTVDAHTVLSRLAVLLHTDIAELAGTGTHAYRDYQATRYEQAGRRLAGLIRDVEAATRLSGHSATMSEIRALTYDAKAALLARTGDKALAWTAADRALAAAEMSGNPLLTAFGAYRPWWRPRRACSSSASRESGGGLCPGRLARTPSRATRLPPTPRRSDESGRLRLARLWPGAGLRHTL